MWKDYHESGYNTKNCDDVLRISDKKPGLPKRNPDSVVTIGARGFEPPASWTRTMRARQTALRPVSV